MTATVLTGSERRRRWSAAEKRRIVEESLAVGASVAEIARRHDVHPNLLHGWRRQARTATVDMAGEKPGRFAVVVAPAGRASLLKRRLPRLDRDYSLPICYTELQVRAAA